MAIRVGRWDCPTCGTKGNLGPDTKCINCGAARPQGVKFYLPANAEIVTEADKIREAKAGVDWICGHCEAQNKALDTECQSCGNPRDDQSDDRNLEEKIYATKDIPRTGEEEKKRTEKEAHPDVYQHVHADRLAAEKKARTRKHALIGAGVFVVFMALLALWKTTIEVQVTGFEWVRTIQLEHYEAVSESSWDSPPSEAFNVTSSQEVHHYDQVSRGYETRTRDVPEKVGEERYVCGQKDLGNGYFEDVYCTRGIYETQSETYEEEVFEDVPVYATKYYYEIMRWVEAHKIQSEGQNHQAKWPEHSPPPPDPDNWRDGEKEGIYTLLLESKRGEKYEEEVGYEYWQKRKKGDQLKAKKSKVYGFYYGIDDPNKDK